MAVIPATGLVGTRMIEAATSEFRALAGLVNAAICQSLGKDWVPMEAIYPDRAIVIRDGRYFAYPYTLDANNQVQLGTPTEVVESYVPVRLAEAAAPAATAAGCTVFLEAVGEPDSGRWLIRIIRAGLSANNVFYPDTVLREAAPRFEGARVFVKSDAEHIKGAGKDVRNLIGGLAGARFVEGKSADTGELQATLTLIEPDGTEAVKLREAHDRGLSALFGFSIDCDGAAKVQLREGRKVRVAQSITKVSSVDLIVEPGAGGELIRLVEAAPTQEDEDMGLRARMIEAIQARNPQFDGASATDEEIEIRYREAVATPTGTHPPLPSPSDAVLQVRLVEARMSARELIGACNLPAPAKEKLTARFVEAQAPFAAADVQKAIDEERAYLARFTESGKPVLHFDDVAQVEDRSKKIGSMLDAFFDPAHKDHGAAHSFRECYIEITGDTRVTGQLADCDMARLREAAGARFVEATMTSASFAEVLGDSITRRMLADYRTPSQYDVWRMLVNIVSVSDFRTQERTRWGGFGDLPDVAEGGDYADGAIPSDEMATYKAAKKGRLSTITMEMIRNDDVGMIRQIPVKLSRAAKRTLAKFVLDFLRANPAIYDSVALFHATHGNLGAAALAAGSWSAARTAMMAQTELDTGERLGIPPKNLWVPAGLEETAFDLFKQRGANNDQSFIQTQAPTIVPVWYWTDANDWCASADPMDIPSIEVGFLDGNQEPEIFVQDNPSYGSLFNSDKITYKVRHIYGGAVTDYRGLYKAVVA